MKNQELNLQASIKKLYQVFSCYTIVDNLRVRSCECCVTNEEIQQLLSKPLQDLNEEDVYPFMTSAITTFGSVDDYKHFLPRIFELIAYSDLLDDFDVYERLNYANWKSWKEEEVLIIETFFYEFLMVTLRTQTILFSRLTDVINVCARYLGINIVLKEIENYMSDTFLNFVVDYKLEAVYILLDNEHLFAFNKWLKKPFVLSKLEELFLRTKDKVEASRISIVYTILEK